MKTSQKTIILDYLKQMGCWVHEYKIRAINTDFGWIGARGDRDVRELIKAGKLLADKDGKYRIVKWKEDTLTKAYFPDLAKSMEFLNVKLSGVKESKQGKLI